MGKFKLICESKGSIDKWMIQERFLLFFWVYIKDYTKVYGYDFHYKPKVFSTDNEAIEHIGDLRIERKRPKKTVYYLD